MSNLNLRHRVLKFDEIQPELLAKFEYFRDLAAKNDVNRQESSRYLGSNKIQGSSKFLRTSKRQLHENNVSASSSLDSVQERTAVEFSSEGNITQEETGRVDVDAVIRFYESKVMSHSCSLK